jgi:hypothetical protein
VGTVGAVEVLEWGKEAPVITAAPASVFNVSRPGERETSEPNEGESDFQVEGDPAGEATEDGWWDLRTGPPVPESAGVSTVQAEPSQCLPREAPRPGLPTAEGQRARKKQEPAIDQQWEEARQHARLRQVFSSGLSSEDEDEEQQGEWRPELYEPP